MNSSVPGPVRRAPPPPPRKPKNLASVNNGGSKECFKEESTITSENTEHVDFAESNMDSEYKNRVSSKVNKVGFDPVVSPNPIPLPCRKDSLVNYKCGYLGKISGQQKSLGQFFGQFSNRSLSRQRWMVLSERSCRLLYYRREGDTEPLGEINIASATFNYSPEDQESSFTIT